MDNYFYYIIDEISTIINDNLKLLNINDNTLTELKEYIFNYNPEIPISNEKLIYFTRMVLLTLINSNFLYNFRDIK